MSHQSQSLLAKVNPKSAVWKYFGYQQDEYGCLIAKHTPVCRMCNRGVKAVKGNTANLLTHLKANHHGEYKMCLTSMGKNYKEYPTSSMVNQYDGLEEEEDSSIILMKEKAKSGIWQYFGYRLDKQGKPKNLDLTTCVVCRKDVVSKGGTKTNMRGHLRSYHPVEYKMCQAFKIGYDKKLALEKHSKSGIKSLEGKTFGVCMLRVPAQIFSIVLDEATLPPPIVGVSLRYANYEMWQRESIKEDDSSVLLMKKKAQSGVWQYFGYQIDEQGKPKNRDRATCVMCRKEIMSNGGTTTSMRRHLRSIHPVEYIKCIESELNGDKTLTFEKVSNTCKADSLSNIDTDGNPNITSSKLSAAKPSTSCYRCEKNLVDTEVINNKRAGARTPNGKIDHDYCWDCFAVLHNIGFTEKYYDVEDESLKDVSDDASSLTTDTEVDCEKTIIFMTDDVPDRTSDVSSSTTKPEVNCEKMIIFTIADASHRTPDVSSSTTETEVTFTTEGAPEKAADIVNLEKATKKQPLDINEFVSLYCRKCDVVFANTGNLQRHIRNHSKEKKLICCFCSKAFKYQHSLKVHEIRHSGTKPYRCQTCGKEFGSREHMTRHNKIHTGEKPYLCSMCGKGFIQKISLIIHEKAHLDGKCFFCRRCNKEFAQITTRNSHEKTHGPRR